MRILPAVVFSFFVLAAAPAHAAAPLAALQTPPDAPAAPKSEPLAGQPELPPDAMWVERVRFLDSMGFDRPVEAFSVLLPRGWTSSGGAHWKGVHECRGEFVTTRLHAASGDGKVRFDAFPTKSYGWSDDPFLRQSMEQAARSGGCGVSRPLTAAQYVVHFARDGIGGARASNVRDNAGTLAQLRRMDEQANAISARYGTGMQQSSTASIADLEWPDGTRGIALVALVSIRKDGIDPFSGRSNGFSTTQILQHAAMRFPEDRRAEAERVLATIVSSYRTNPVWQSAKDDFLAKLGSIEHAGRMERIRLMGEQARAYARSASEAHDASLRSWETRQASDDKSHRSFVQSIREVETWRAAEGSVELSAGYERAFSRGDGSYILTNSATFDPAAAFRDQAWKPMHRAD